MNLLDECLQLQKSGKHIKSHCFLYICNPYCSQEFHDNIKYQCPGLTLIMVGDFEGRLCRYSSSEQSSIEMMRLFGYGSYGM